MTTANFWLLFILLSDGVGDFPVGEAFCSFSQLEINMSQQHSIEHLGLGQPVAHPSAVPNGTMGTEQVRDSQGDTKLQEGPVSVPVAPVSTRDTTAIPSSTTTTPAQIVGKEIPTTNPAVHVVLTNPPATPERQSTMPPAVARARAETNASVLSTASSRSYASTTSTDVTGDGDDDDDDADDYDPSSVGGDAGEKSCLKEKRIKEWRKRFHPKDGEELLCSTFSRFAYPLPFCHHAFHEAPVLSFH